MTKKRFTPRLEHNRIVWITDTVEEKILFGEDTVDLLNEQDETITTLNNQLNNFKLHSKDLEEENKLLKEALREELQDNGNAYYIKIFDKLFNLNYDEWDNNERYRESMDWEEQLQLKELSDLYD